MSDTKGEEILKRIQRLSKEREEEYQLREAAFEKRQRANEIREQKLLKLAEDLELREKNYETLMDALAKAEQEATEKTEQLKAEQEKFRSDQEEFERTVSEKMMEIQVMEEETRNEKMKQQRIREEYESRIAVLDSGEAAEQAQEQKIQAEEEFRKKLEEKEEQIKELSGKIKELEKENGQLEAEKGELFRKLLSLPSEGQTTVLEPEKAPEEVPNFGTQTVGQEESEESGNRKEQFTAQEEHIEELTADVLYNYLDRNESHAELHLHHADGGEQVWMTKQGLSYYFVFEDPFYFNIRASRKSSRYLTGGFLKKGLLEELNSRYPGVKFSYDEQEQEVVAEGYFTSEMSPNDFMSHVDTIADCFRKKEE